MDDAELNLGVWKDSLNYTDGGNRFQRSIMLDFDFVCDSINDAGNQAGRNIDIIDFFQIPLDFTSCHSSGIEGNGLVVKAGKAGLFFGDIEWLEVAVPVVRDLNRHLAEFALDRFCRFSIVGIAVNGDKRGMFLVVQMIGQLGLQCPF